MRHVEYHCSDIALLQYLHNAKVAPTLLNQYTALYLRLEMAESIMVTT